MGWPAACLFSPSQHMLFTVGLVPSALFSRGASLLRLFSWPPAPQTGSLIFRPVWAIQSDCMIQRDQERERGGRGRSEGGKRAVQFGKEISSHVLQAELFRRLIIVPLQI